MDHRLHGLGPPPVGVPPRAPPPPPPPPTQTHPDMDRERSLPQASQKRSRMDTRTPPVNDLYSHPHHPQHPLPHHHHQQQAPPQMVHGVIPPSRQPFKDVSRSPEMERVSGPGPFRQPHHPPPHPSQQPQRHESVPQNNPINPTSSRSSPFLPPNRTSTPEAHQRISSGHNSPRMYRGHPTQEAMMHQHQQHHQQQQQPQQQHQQHPQHQHQHQQSQHQQHSQHPSHPQYSQHPPPPQHRRGMPPPSSPHHNPLAPPQPQTQPLRPPPPGHHHSSGPPHSVFSQGPGGGPGRELPALPTHRPSMSISSMLGASDPAPPSHPPHPSPIPTHQLPPSAPRQGEFSPLKRPYTPDLNGPTSASGLDRNREASSNSASPNTTHTPLPGVPGSKGSRITPPEIPYRGQMPYHPLAPPHDREHNDPLAMHGPPPRPMSQPNNHSISSVLQESQGPRGHVRSESHGERYSGYGKGRDKGREDLRINERVFEVERERHKMDREREREREKERERERERKERKEREQREREVKEREAKEAREREKEREKEREREREQRARDKEREKGERERERERNERSNGIQVMAGGRPFYQPPQTSTSHLSYPMAITSGMPPNGPQNHMEIPCAPLSVPGVPNSSTISLPQTSTAGAGGLGPTPAPLPTAAATGREDFRSFTGYTTPMPPSPFAITASLPTVLPPVGDGARDSRRQNLQNGREEPARAEDALQRGLSRALSGGLSSALVEEDRRRRVDKERDGNSRMSGPNIGNQSPTKRLGSGFSMGTGMTNMTKGWDDSFQKGPPESNREDGKLPNALGKRERDEEEVGKMEKKKKHHHHHPPHAVHHHRHHHKVDDEPAGSSLEIPPARAGARSKSPNSMAMAHPHHVHHHQVTVHHHHHATASPAPPARRVETSLLIDSSKVFASLASKPRHYLGSTIYQPTPTPKQGYSVTQPLLPRFEGRENCIFQVRIPRRFLTVEQRRDVHRRRCVWGTEVYTDDSDVLGVLVHLGKVPGVLPEGSASDLVAETPGCRKIVSQGGAGITNMASTSSSPVRKKGKGGTQVVEEGPTVPPGKDLVVNLLILPTLQKYTGSVRNAFKSRSWNTIHDGMSYSIWDMEWVEAGEAEARGGGGRKRRLNEREWVRRWGELPPSRGGGGVGQVGWNKGRWSESKRGMREGNVTEVGA